MTSLTREMIALKGVVNKSKNRNIRFVKVRTAKYCKYCRQIIRVNEECLTINKKSVGRRWVCIGCLNAIIEYNKTKARINNIAFNDDGGFLALQTILEEDEAELYDREIL